MMNGKAYRQVLRQNKTYTRFALSQLSVESIIYLKFDLLKTYMPMGSCIFN